MELKDYGNKPFVCNIEEATVQNENYRTVLWTGKHLQVTLMNIKPGEDIGLEVHPDHDQFLRLEQGQGLVEMGDSKDHLTFKEDAKDDFCIIVPAGTWHNVTNTGTEDMRVYSIYGPAHHPHGAVHPTFADAMEAEAHEDE